MKHEQLLAILADIKILDRLFIATPSDHGGWHLQVTYIEADVDTGKIAPQYSRQWFIKANATETDVVETAFAATMRSYDHVVQEHFTYRGKRIYSPHFTIDQRLSLCDSPEPEQLAQDIAEGPEQRVTEAVIRSFEHALREGLFWSADDLFRCLDIAKLPPAALLGALSITFHAKDKLKSRDAFLARVETKLRTELGDERTDDLLKHRR